MQRPNFFTRSLLVLALCAGWGGGLFAGEAPAKRPAAGLAREILQAAGVTSGLCVHLGCGDGHLTAELARGGSFLVHGLDTDAAAVSKARSYLRSQKCYGGVSVEARALARLPYTDGIVNLLVVDDLPRLFKAGLSRREVLRVLSPLGVAMLGKAAAAPGSKGFTRQDLLAGLRKAGWGNAKLVQGGGVWAKIIKPRPIGLDEWTQLQHDASGSPTSKDSGVGPLSGMRWLAGPAWPMSGHKRGFSKILSAGGVNLYVTINEVANFKRSVPRRAKFWYLVARDAYNGLLLWSRPLTDGTQKRRANFLAHTVLAGRRVITVLGGKLAALDARTGQTIRTYAAGPVPEVSFADGLLLLREGRYGQTLKALDPESGKIRWTFKEGGHFVAGGGHVFFFDRKTRLVKLDLKSGQEIWRQPVQSWCQGRPRLVFYKKELLVLEWEYKRHERVLQVLSAATGKGLWEYPPGPGAPSYARNYIFHAQGLLWLLFPAASGRGHVVWEGRNPQTGVRTKHYAIQMGTRYGNCGISQIATEDYFFDGRPLTVLSWKDGRTSTFKGTRGSCGGSYTPANGLLYTQPLDCSCVPGALRGFIGWESKPLRAPRPPPAKGAAKGAERRLQKGPALGAGKSFTPQNNSPAKAQAAWRTFRHDARRSNATAAALPLALKRLWRTPLLASSGAAPASLKKEWQTDPGTGGDPLTQPVLSGGQLFVCATQAQCVLALDAKTGAQRWRFTTGGRLDTPPTLYRGLCLVGSRDGYVYALRARDGKLAWRFQAAPEDKRIVAFGQLESKWPLTGGVLVDHDLAYFAAGRGSETDGGLWVYALEPLTGSVVWTSRSTVQPKRRGFPSDILTGGNGYIAMGANWKMDPKTGKNIVVGHRGKKEGLGGLDRSWRWLNADNTIRFFASASQRRVIGSLWVLGDKTDYFFEQFIQRWNGKVTPATLGAAGKKSRTPKWSFKLAEPRQVEAMLKAGGRLFAAGVLDRRERAKGGFLWALSAADGKKVKEWPLEAAPVAEGLAAAGGRLYLATRDGKVLCFGKE